MPRTVVRKKSIKKEKIEDTTISTFSTDCVDEIITRKCALKKHTVAKKIGEFNDSYFDNILLKIPDPNITLEEFSKIGNIKEIIMNPELLKTLDYLSITNNTAVLNSNTNINNTTYSSATSSYAETQKRPRKQNRSADEGYSTENSATTGNSIAKTKTARRSRSATRATKTVNRFKTPLNKQTKENSYGLITPKAKPHTPQVILRRPAQGEVAWSLQGSPLMTWPMPPATEANVNIPLPDGRIISVLPNRGLRPSVIPEVDPNIREQLKALRENLAKMLY